MRPLSRNGEVKLNSTDPLEQLYINLNFFSNELNLITLHEGVRMIEDSIINGDGIKDIIEGGYPWPMPCNSDRAIILQILERAQTGYHLCGTCRLGKDSKRGVVDLKLQVYGVRNLHVIDASILPIILDCRIQSDVYMVGEKRRTLLKLNILDFTIKLGP
jgi:choline dehydrogenase